MKFFKHFTDAHRGTSIQSIINRLGMEGLGRYWILVEICAEKLEKEMAEEYTEAHCIFRFDQRYLRDTLRLHQLSKVSMFLACIADVGLMSFSCVDHVVVISMPKLLECLDRDTKRARTVRATAAPKIKKKIKSKIVEVEETQTAQTAAPISSAKKKREIIKIKNAQELVDTFSEEFLAQLRETYGDHFVGQEIPQMALKIIATEGYKTNYQSFAQAWMRYSSKHAEREEAQMRKASNVNNVMAMVENG